MSKILTPETQKIIEIILKEAEVRRTNAAYNGAMGDGGASTLEAQVKFYKYGAMGILPPEWKQFEKMTDPDYQTYLRLKQKFEQ